jgi:hypothetical protein
LPQVECSAARDTSPLRAASRRNNKEPAMTGTRKAAPAFTLIELT